MTETTSNPTPPTKSRSWRSALIVLVVLVFILFLGFLYRLGGSRDWVVLEGGHPETQEIALDRTGLDSTGSWLVWADAVERSVCAYDLRRQGSVTRLRYTAGRTYTVGLSWKP